MDTAVVNSLSRPELYPSHAAPVQLIHTHISLVCLAGPDVFKFKKALKLPFLDFSSLERRRVACEDEVRLNRRLCPDTYLGVASLVRDGETSSLHLRLGPPHEDDQVLDYAVHMKRLPQERMLDVLLEQDAVSRADMQTLARAMADMHAEAERGGMVPEYGAPENLERLARENFEQTRRFCPAVFEPHLHSRLEELSRTDLEWLLPRLSTRAAQGRIVDGHGDLHSRNICLCDPPAIYDCIEFSAALRCSDVALDNAFLLMDLRYRGHPELGAEYLAAYIDRTGDEEQRELAAPLVRYRAMVRAKVNALLARDEAASEAERAAALDSARRHVELIAESALNGSSPVLLIACGLPGAGKSHLLGALAHALRLPLVATDLVRKELAGVVPTQSLAPETYTAEFSERVYEEALKRAENHLAAGSVIVDAGFRSRGDRQRAVELARHLNVRIACLEVRTERRLLQQRLEQRKEQGSVSDAGPDVLMKLEAQFEPPDASEGLEVLTLDGAAETWSNVARIAALLLTHPGR